MFLLKFLVPALALFLLLNTLWLPGVGRFSCSWVPWFAPQARAGDDCPGSLRAAWDDAEWAAGRFAEIEDDHRTTGLFYDGSGRRRKYDSRDEKGTDAERAREILRRVGAQTAENGTYPAATHVEVKVAAMMRERGTKMAIVVINNDRGPCRYYMGLSCQEVLPLILPRGTKLRVWFPTAGGPMRYLDFTGR
jgi:hypothetical protein